IIEQLIRESYKSRQNQQSAKVVLCRAEAHASSPSRRIIQRASELLVIAGRLRASMGVRSLRDECG
ncbi:hypothetical protein, partial [Bradyrhizobium sp. 17]|uniref:hypothetical protein n=1 Tax=Bradyrhizobium sp. 17 TaxID=2782649 RepID=UPI001FF8B2A2